MSGDRSEVSWREHRSASASSERDVPPGLVCASASCRANVVALRLRAECVAASLQLSSPPAIGDSIEFSVTVFNDSEVPVSVAELANRSGAGRVQMAAKSVSSAFSFRYQLTAVDVVASGVSLQLSFDARSADSPVFEFVSDDPGDSSSDADATIVRWQSDPCDSLFDCAAGEPVVNGGEPVPCNSTVPITLNWVDCNGARVAAQSGVQALVASHGVVTLESINGVRNTYRWQVPATGFVAQPVTFSYGDVNNLCTFNATIQPCDVGPGEFIYAPLGALAAAPGLEGYGAQTNAGRGGEVRVVTNLNDSGPGSLREAVAGVTPKMVLFDVAGEIQLRDPTLRIGANTSIYGHCAPGAIELTSHPSLMSPGQINTGSYGGDTLIQHLRFRPGPASVDTSAWDCLQIRGARTVLDHCDLGWSEDELLQIDECDEVTVSACLFHEALGFQNSALNGRHDRGIHLWKNASRVTFLRNMMYGFGDRAPNIEGDLIQMCNNLAYQVGEQRFPAMIHANTNNGMSKNFRAVIEGNLAIDSGSVNLGFCIGGGNEYPAASFTLLYRDNYFQRANGALAAAIWPDGPIPGGFCGAGNFPADTTVFRSSVDPTDGPSLSKLPVSQLEAWMQANVGASIHSDATRTRVLTLLATRTGRPRTDCVGGDFAHPGNDNCALSVPYTGAPVIAGNRYLDLSKRDAIPDAWKRAVGVDPSVDGRSYQPYNDGWTLMDFFAHYHGRDA